MRKLALTIGLVLFAVALQAKTYIVCAGIADYPGTRNDLRVSANDAVTIANIFAKNNHAEGLCYTNQDATVANVLNGMSQVFAKAGTNDVVVFFFSGHGIPGGFVCYDGYLYYNKVYRAMSQCKAQNKVILADACFSGKMRNTRRRNDDYSKVNAMLFLSSRSDEMSMEMPRQTGFGNSLFTAYLERGLRGGADTDRNRTITAKELYNYVHNGVVSLSRGRQHPVMWGKFNGNMPIIKW